MKKRDLQQRIDQYRESIGRELDRLPDMDFVDGIQVPVKYALDARGKCLRPVLVLLVGEGLGIAQDRLMKTATAVEILHTFTLVHDDIMDRDEVRRGQATVHVRWNDSTAILTGDALFALAFQQLLKTETRNLNHLSRYFCEIVLRICEGQALDMAFEKQDRVSQVEYLEMVQKKTGEILGFACSCPAIVGAQDDRIIDGLYHFGSRIGQAFQIQDDLLEITSSRETMGKSLDSDILAEKKTYPLILALSGMPASEQREFLAFIKANRRKRDRLIMAYEKHHCLSRSRKKVQQLLHQALEDVNHLPLALQQDLNSFIDFLAQRKS